MMLQIATSGKQSGFDLNLDFVWLEIVYKFLFLELYSIKENSNVLGFYYFVYSK